MGKNHVGGFQTLHCADDVAINCPEGTQKIIMANLKIALAHCRLETR